MEKPFKFNQIFMTNPNPNNTYVNYQNKLQPKMDFEPTALEILYNRHKNTLIEATVKECEQYLDDEAWLWKDTFPCVQNLTGHWYLSSVDLQEEKGNIIISLCFHFLGYYPKECAREEIDDYLEMEAWFDYDSVQDIFLFDCFDTNSI